MKNFLTAALFVAIVGGACSAQSQPQSLADIARQNKKDKKAVRVFNEDDIASASGVVSVVGDESNRVTDSQPASPQKSAADNSKTAPAPTGSNAQVADLKKKLDAYKTEQQNWKTSAKQYEDLLAKETDDFRRATYKKALDNDRQNVTIYQQKIDQANAELAKAAESQSSNGSKPPSTPAAPSTQ